ncbi:hypothetical protein P3T37_002250 [Kitasatospora sp. MAA4]|uniref:hypothetical protein n=1 Tax=Kitasatospora sp. MAA4 TaxID=3035093 RepID=UPI0024746FF0|nr:hypothetical protein [Kitasatospora sp. MAA4]MDH6132864.1 hypothetical protein [Kitasatospora sp. MAA4]
MPEFSTNTLALADDIDDRERASNGSSRYGAYLDQRARWFTDDGDPLGAVEFARAAWQVATSPVMSPGYVDIRPDLSAVTAHVTEDYELVLRVDVPIRQSALAHRPDDLGDWTAAWGRDPWRTTGDRWRALVEPERITRSALLVTATLLIPVPDHRLTEPSANGPGALLTFEAKDAVATLLQTLNAHAHLVNELMGTAR